MIKKLFDAKEKNFLICKEKNILDKKEQFFFLTSYLAYVIVTALNNYLKLKGILSRNIRKRVE